MMNRRKELTLGILVASAGLFLFGCGNIGLTPATETPEPTSTPEPPVASDPLRTGDVAPDFTLPDSSGNLVSLADELLDNRLVILVFYQAFD